MMRPRTIAGIVAGAALLTCATVLPAAANDVTLKGGFRGQGSTSYWKDKSDTLIACLGGGAAFRRAVAHIRPASGKGPSFSITDGLGRGCTSTGNLNIPEDRRYVMTLTVYGVDTYKSSVVFYT